MDKIILDIKKKKNQIDVSFDDEVIRVEPELMIKYHISIGKTITLEDYHQLIKENAELSSLREGLKALKKMMTIQEMKEHLTTKGYQTPVVQTTLKKLIERHYLDDLQYASMYVNMKKYQEGPEMIIFKLTQKGVKEAFIYQAISAINEYDLLTEVVQSKLNQMKSKTQKQAFQSIRVLLISKGFHREVIDAVLSSPDTHYVGDESKLLEKAYDKIYKTYAHKYQGYELEQKIKEKLYQKGFAYDVIKNYIEEKKLQSW